MYIIRCLDSIRCLNCLNLPCLLFRQHPLLESTLFVLMSYSTFLLAEVFELTGIVAVLFCGVCQVRFIFIFNQINEEKIARTEILLGFSVLDIPAYLALRRLFKNQRSFMFKKISNPQFSSSSSSLFSLRFEKCENSEFRGVGLRPLAPPIYTPLLDPNIIPG